MSRKKVLILSGGWAGHYPAQIEAFAREHLLQDYEVATASSLDALEILNLREFDLIVPNWTQGSLTADQESALVSAVASGVGMAAWHGVADAFNDNHLFKFALGGQFICHPGDFVSYRVEFMHSDDPIVAGLASFELTSEQYYMHVDPANEVLATTTFSGVRFPWIAGSKVPVAWKRQWGRGRVFYHSIGHSVTELAIPEVLSLTRRGIEWAMRDLGPREQQFAAFSPNLTTRTQPEKGTP